MKKILKIIGILIISNIKKIIIIAGILMISSFSYYGAVDENGQKVISFEQNATQSAMELKSEEVKEKQEVEQIDKQREVQVTAKIEEQKKEITEPIEKKQEVKAKEKTKAESTTVKQLSETTKVEEKTEQKEIVKEQKQEEKIEEESKPQEIKQESNYTEVEVKVAEKTECIDNKHCAVTGNSNKWFEKQSEAIAEYNAELEKWSQKCKSGEITYEELVKKSPYGYETWSCPKCNQYTLNYYYN